MPAVDWRFPAYLVGAMALGLVLTYLQMRAYNVQLNRALRMAEGEHLMLVSGRGRSFRGGAIVIAIVDTAKREIVWARAMTGATVFAKFRDVPALIGPTSGAVQRVNGKQFQAAVEMALAQAGPALARATAEATAASPSQRQQTKHTPTTPVTRASTLRPRPTLERKN